MRTYFAPYAVVLVFLAGADTVRACNVPVFRFALERWNKRGVDDVYSLYVFHDGAIADDLRDSLNKLDATLEDPNHLANLLTYRVDASKPIRDEFIEAIHKREKAKAPAVKGPWMVLRFPDTWGLEKSLHVGPYDPAVIQGWLHSPLRQQIARRILQGHSVAFLFLESGNAARDDADFARIRKQLEQAEAKLTLPALTDAPKDKLLRNDIPLKISFTMLRLPRADAKEKYLVEMLRAMDHHDLIGSRANDPVLIPIYGRGIAMVNECLIGKGITEENLDALTRFLVAACSCEVRRLNPGIEMLSAVNWDGPPPPEPKEETHASAGIASTTNSGTISEPSGSSSGFALWRNLVWTLGGAFVVVLFGSMLVLGRSRKIDPPSGFS